MRAEHASFATALLTGYLLVRSHGWALTHARWLGLKVGLVVFLLLPLVAMHAWVVASWIAPGLRPGADAEALRRLERGLGIEMMLRTLELVVGLPGLLLLVWLSVRQPF